jgi:cysteinyl-tRNA synthetase
MTTSTLVIANMSRLNAFRGLGHKSSSQYPQQRYFSSFIEISNNLRSNDASSHQTATIKFNIDSKHILKWYSCGPTVYDSSHLGHARSYVCTDIIRRIFQSYFNIPVDFALGITDIDDKIIDKSRNISTASNSAMNRMLEVARKYEDDFFDDMDKLNVLRPNAVLRVTDHIDEIINYIKGIESAGCAYIAEDGVYFDITTFTSQHNHVYGKLDCAIPPITEEQQTKSGKRSPRDFALWKFSKPDEPQWSSPWGLGRPGWHIECSAMTNSYFGQTFDIHSGGVDLKFPHHTNEIAQW